MTEHLANGQFARKEVTESVADTTNSGTSEVPKSVTRKTKSGRPFQPGHPKLGGRKKGTPNKITRDVKEFLGLLVNKVSVQDAVEARIEKGDAVAFFRALEHVLGKPKENEGEPQKHEVVFRWQK